MSALVRGNKQRAAAVRELFTKAGCAAEDQPVKGSKLPNILCTLPGESEQTIIVGAHYDQVMAGQGAIDNWTGAALLPLLYESLQLRKDRRFTFRFIAFTDEEVGLVGSRHYVKQLPKDPPPPIRAMVNIDSLGLGPTNIWHARSDKKLGQIILSLARNLEIPAGVVDVQGVGDSDSHYFDQRKIPVLDLHSVTRSTFGILHSPQDRAEAVKLDDYYGSYRLITAFLAFLDAGATRN